MLSRGGNSNLYDVNNANFTGASLGNSSLIASGTGKKRKGAGMDSKGKTSTGGSNALNQTYAAPSGTKKRKTATSNNTQVGGKVSKATLAAEERLSKEKAGKKPLGNGIYRNLAVEDSGYVPKTGGSGNGNGNGSIRRGGNGEDPRYKPTSTTTRGGSRGRDSERGNSYIDDYNEDGRNSGNGYNVGYEADSSNLYVAHPNSASSSNQYGYSNVGNESRMAERDEFGNDYGEGYRDVGGTNERGGSGLNQSGNFQQSHGSSNNGSVQFNERRNNSGPRIPGGPDYTGNRGNGADEESDEARYCYCDRVSFGEMMACDDDDCEKEWVSIFFSKGEEEIEEERSWSKDRQKRRKKGVGGSSTFLPPPFSALSISRGT